MTHHIASTYHRFLYEATGSISASPGWDTSSPQITSQHFVRLSPSNLMVPIHLPGWREAQATSLSSRYKQDQVDQVLVLQSWLGKMKALTLSRHFKPITTEEKTYRALRPIAH